LKGDFKGYEKNISLPFTEFIYFNEFKMFIQMKFSYFQKLFLFLVSFIEFSLLWSLGFEPFLDWAEFETLKKSKDF
jgi:hypothetical protein